MKLSEILVTTFSLNLAALSALAAAPPEITSENYELVWADEFEVDGEPNPKNWTYERGYVRNNEDQWYHPKNAQVKDGKLVITAKRENVRNPNYEKGHKSWKKNREFIKYSSSCLLSKGLKSWQYGRFEIKAKIKTEEGLWPAIWFLGDHGVWPNSGEIDLMEFYAGDILANACWGGKKGSTWDSSHTPVMSFNDPDWDSKYHIWRMDWDEKTIKLYLDDQLLNVIDLTKTINPKGQKVRNPFHQKHYILLNLAIGGRSGGDPSKTKFPSKYEIDYVRVYQQKK